MRRLFASLFTLAFMTAAPAFAVMEDYPSVKLQGLDKSVGRTVTFEATVGSTIQYGPLFIKIHACRKAPPIEKPESAAFLQIWEVPPGEQKSEWVFSGWMFASSPALSAMDHPVYDVWVLECTGRDEPNPEATSPQTDEKADQTDLTPSDTTSTLAINSEAVAPAAEEAPIPTDSEAESDTPASTAVPAGEAGASPETMPGPAGPVPADDLSASPTDPAAEQGFTAYDLLKQQQNGASQASPEQAPNPSAPY